MRFSTRTFLGSFVPFALLLVVSFWTIRTRVIATVREGLAVSVKEHQVALARERERSELRNRAMLQGVTENAALKAGLQLLATEPNVRDQARNTVQDQLSEICDALNFDFMMVSGEQGEPLAAIVRAAGGFVPVKTIRLRPPEQGFFSADDRLYEIISVPINEGGAQVATLTVGGRFDISRYGVPAVLLHNGSVVDAQMRDLAPAEIEKALRSCTPGAECEPHIRDQTFLSLPLGLSGEDPAGYSLRSLQNVDAASAPVQLLLRNLFLVAELTALAAALGIGALSSRSIVRPLADVAARLRQSTAIADLPEFPESTSGVQEIRDLTEGFNQAAKAVREGRDRLTRAYVEFVGSLAQALDARDSYTAGHSRRVSDYSCAIATALDLPSDEIETIRVGALLHDLGKIGISDLVLQKPGRLTPEETELIRQHPVIGRRILENVHGLEPYLGMVELHHENWDGTGYPHGLKSDQTPFYARIVKVADAYDAMTSDRPYRRGMSHAEAIGVLTRASGSEMDAVIVNALAGLGDVLKQRTASSSAPSLQSLAYAVQDEAAQPAPASQPLAQKERAS